MAKFLASDKITMYPTAHRGTGIDVASFLNTEDNLTSTKELSEVPQFNNYSHNDGNDLIVYIKGYKFRVDELYTINGNTINFNSTTLANIQPETGDELYAYIKLELNSTYGNIIIPNTDPNVNASSLDYNTVFYGLSFGTSTEVTSDTTSDLAILIGKKVNNVWAPVFQKHKLASYEISNGIGDVDDDPISKTFNTQTINVQNVNLTGDIIKGNQSVIVPAYTSSKKNYVLSVDASGNLVWRQYYNESLSSVN